MLYFKYGVLICDPPAGVHGMNNGRFSVPPNRALMKELQETAAKIDNLKGQMREARALQERAERELHSLEQWAARTDKVGNDLQNIRQRIAQTGKLQRELQVLEASLEQQTEAIEQ